MKKYLCLVLTLALVAVFFAGCQQDEINTPTEPIPEPTDAPTDLPASIAPTENDTTAPSEELPTEPEEPKELNVPMDMEGELVLSTEETITSYGVECKYSIPQINCGSEDALKINAEINEVYGKIVEEARQAAEEDVSYHWYQIDWSVSSSDYYRFTLIIECLGDGDYVSYSVYNFDGLTGKQVTNEEVVEEAGLTESKFLALVETIVEEQTEANFGSMTGDDFYREILAEVTSDEEINMDMPMFINEDGELCVITGIGTPAGACVYEKIVPVY